MMAAERKPIHKYNKRRWGEKTPPYYGSVWLREWKTDEKLQDWTTTKNQQPHHQSKDYCHKNNKQPNKTKDSKTDTSFCLRDLTYLLTYLFTYLPADLYEARGKKETGLIGREVTISKRQEAKDWITRTWNVPLPFDLPSIRQTDTQAIQQRPTECLWSAFVTHCRQHPLLVVSQKSSAQCSEKRPSRSSMETPRATADVKGQAVSLRAVCARRWYSQTQPRR